MADLKHGSKVEESAWCVEVKVFLLILEAVVFVVWESYGMWRRLCEILRLWNCRDMLCRLVVADGG